MASRAAAAASSLGSTLTAHWRYTEADPSFTSVRYSPPASVPGSSWKWSLIWTSPVSSTSNSRSRGSSSCPRFAAPLTSTMDARRPFSPRLRSLAAMRYPGDIPLMVMISSESTLPPEASPSAGLSTNGSSLRPQPPMKAGSAVVLPGNGPVTPSTDSRRSSSRMRTARSSRSRSIGQQHHQYLARNDSRAVEAPTQSLYSGEVVPSQTPSPSVSGSSGSVPASLSSASVMPSLSSSSSASSPMPSPSKSRHSVGSVGNASGPAWQTPATAVGPSQIPSPSVSGLLGSIPRAASSRSDEPSLSSSWSSTRPPCEAS